MATARQTDADHSGPALAQRPALGALATQLSLQRSAGNAAVQRLLTSVEADSVRTPAEAVKVATGVPAGQLLLPGGKVQPAGSVLRPKKVSAVVDKSTIRSDERAKDGILSKVTAMARAEQRILQGADMLKFFDAGHLIGDQLVAGDNTDSFEYWNLAPQVSPFNTPAYSSVEEKIKALAAAGATVAMEATLQYPGDYTVKVGHLKQRGIGATTKAADDTAVSIPRRIPTQWNMHGVVAGAPPSVVGDVQQHGTPGVPSLGQPFGMKSADVRVVQAGLPGALVGHVVEGAQWSPSDKVESGDILSLLSKTFADLGSPEDIARRILTPEHTVHRASAVRLIKEAAGEVALAQLDLSGQLSRMHDAQAMQQYLQVSDPMIREHINAARAETTELGMAVHHLVVAKGWVDALTEQATDLGREQQQHYVFPREMERQLRESTSEFRYGQEFNVSVTQAAPQFAWANPEQADAIEAQRRQLKDLRGAYEHNLPAVGGGELILHSFGPPQLLYDQWVQIEGGVVVRVRDVTKEVTLDDMATGRWHVKYAHS